jgi:predicted phosphodiesterase
MTTKKKKLNAVSTESEIVAIVSDIHFDLHDPATWNAFKKWFKDVKPAKVVVLGDFVDLGMMSRYIQGKSAPVHAIPQIQMFVREMNELLDFHPELELFICEGNHDERWAKHILGHAPHVYKDALGLTLEEQCYSQGLSRDVHWVREDLINKGLKCGPFILRHGHNQSGKFGGGKHLAANRLTKTMGVSEVFGHFHRAQMMCQTAMGKTAIAIANPCMTGDHEYANDPDWQRGFTVIELYGPDNKYSTPSVIVMNDGHFAWRGKVYDGNA